MIIIDLDSSVYRIGFPSDNTSYDVICFTQDGDPCAQANFPKKKEAVTYGESFDSYEVTAVKNPEPIENVLYSAKKGIQHILDRCADYGPEYVLYLSGPNNFRAEEGFATIKPYKGTRSQEAPHHYFNIRHYYSEHWGAMVIHNCEADDMCSIKAQECIANGEKFVVASIDKDLDMIPGHHYNPMRDVHYHMNDREAIQHFYKQMLSGDATDNIGGCYKVGLKSVHLQAIEDMHSEAEMYNYVVDVYKESYEKKGCPYAHMSVMDVLLENGRLLWMQTEPNQLWTPPHLPFEYLESFE